MKTLSIRNPSPPPLSDLLTLLIALGGTVLSIFLSPSACAQTGACVTAPPGLISWWPAEGNAADAAGSNPGTLVNRTTFTAGQVGRAFAFNGIDQLVQVPDAPSLNPTNGLTLEGWIYVSAFTASSIAIAGKDDPYSDRQYLLGIGNASGHWAFRAHVGVPSGYWYFDGATALVTNTWYHAAMTYDGSFLRLYVNGNLDGDLAVSGPIVITSHPLLIGGHAEGPWNFDGRVDELSLYNRPLSATEIQAIYSAGSAGKCRSLMAPSITSQPDGQSVYVGDTAEFSASAAGDLPLSFQWQFNGAPLVGQTASSLSLANVQLIDSGNYSVLVSNPAGSVLSSNATLAVRSRSSSCDSVPSGLVSWWPGEGNAADVYGDNNGTMLPGITFVPGIVEHAFNFDGVTGAVVVPAANNLAVKSFTIETWIYPTDISSTPHPIVEYGNSNAVCSLNFWYNSGIILDPA